MIDLGLFSLFSVKMDDAFLATPAGNTSPGLGDDRIRELKSAINARLDQEHAWHDSAETGDMIHKKGSAITYYQAAAPTLRPDGVTALDSNDDGRLWVDSDTKLVQVWDGSVFADLLCVGSYADFTVGDDLIVTDDASVGGDLTVTGAQTIGGNLTVTGTITGAAQTEAGVIVDQGGGSPLACTVYSGTWNMAYTATQAVTLLMLATKIRSVTAGVCNNMGSMFFPAGSSGLSLTIDEDSGQVILTRAAGSVFQASAFNAADYYVVVGHIL